MYRFQQSPHTPYKEEKSLDEKKRARDPSAGGDGDARASEPTEEDAGKRDTGAPDPANAVWKVKRQLIESAVGEATYRSWLSLLTPESDDGKTLLLASPTRFITDKIRRDFAEQIGQITERKIEIQTRSYAGPAARERQRREANAGASP